MLLLKKDGSLLLNFLDPPLDLIINKRACIFNVMEIFIMKQNFLLCLSYRSAWHKAMNTFVRSYGIRKSASLVVCLFSLDNQ